VHTRRAEPLPPPAGLENLAADADAEDEEEFDLNAIYGADGKSWMTKHRLLGASTVTVPPRRIPPGQDPAFVRGEGVPDFLYVTDDDLKKPALAATLKYGLLLSALTAALGAKRFPARRDVRDLGGEGRNIGELSVSGRAGRELFFLEARDRQPPHGSSARVAGGGRRRAGAAARGRGRAVSRGARAAAAPGGGARGDAVAAAAAAVRRGAAAARRSHGSAPPADDGDDQRAAAARSLLGARCRAPGPRPVACRAAARRAAGGDLAGQSIQHR
jgi:hypothetical protein